LEFIVSSEAMGIVILCALFVHQTPDFRLC